MSARLAAFAACALFANVYLVGTCGITSLPIVSEAGHALIGGGRVTLGPLALTAALDCDLLLTPHPAASTLYERLAGDAPLSHPAACRSYAAYARERLEARLREERGE